MKGMQTLSADTVSAILDLYERYHRWRNTTRTLHADLHTLIGSVRIVHGEQTSDLCLPGGESYDTFVSELFELIDAAMRAAGIPS